MIESHPEAKVVVKSRKAKPLATLLHISYYPNIMWKSDQVANVDMSSREMAVLDVSVWSQKAKFQLFCKETATWKASCSELQIHFWPQVPSISEVPLLPPDILLDDDPLEAVLSSKPLQEEVALAEYEEKRDSIGVGVSMESRPLNTEERSILLSLIEKKHLLQVLLVAFGP